MYVYAYTSPCGQCAASRSSGVAFSQLLWTLILSTFYYDILALFHTETGCMENAAVTLLLMFFTLCM